MWDTSAICALKTSLSKESPICGKIAQSVHSEFHNANKLFLKKGENSEKMQKAGFALMH
jgi:hypothetical protein